MKFMLWLAIGYAVFWLLRKKKPGSRVDMPQADGGSHVGSVETMVPCLQCGVYVPASEAVRNSSGSIFCCEEHGCKHASL